MVKDNKNVYSVTSRIIKMLEYSNAKGFQNTAALAKLRNSAGRSLEECEEVWPIIFENFPESFLSRTGNPTCEENAVFSTLQLYAICMQGSEKNVRSDPEFKGSMGRSLASGRNESTKSSFDRRFNALITAVSFEEFVYHLRQITKLLRSKSTAVVNFSKLANDLLWYQKGKDREVCLKWAEDYYITDFSKEDEEEEN